MEQDKDKVIIRAGISSVIPFGATVNCDVSGTFSSEDVRDVIEMLKIVIRSIQRQHDRAFVERKAEVGDATTTV